MADMLATYPGTTVARVFVGAGKSLPAWDGPVFGPLVAAGVVAHLSFKTWDLAPIVRLVDTKPAGLLLALTYAHEPEQGSAAGDPTLELFHARWAELAAGLADHPRRGELLLVPVYTRFWWQAHPGDLRWLVPDVDAYGWDVYNNGGSYRRPDDLLSIPRAIAQRTGLPYLLPELGAVRLAGDAGGEGRSAWMRAILAAARGDGALAVCWFHKDEWDLTGPGSAGEQQTWRELIREASVDWHLAPALVVLRSEIDLRWPNRDKTSDGSIGDAAHQASTSDHNPNLRGYVDAIDVDNDGIDPYAVIAAFERHPSAHYWIYQRQIADKDDGWRRRPYDGPSPHTEHVHFSIRQNSAAEQNEQPWGILEDDDMDQATFDKLMKGTLGGKTDDAKAVQALIRALPWQYPVRTNASALAVFGEIRALVGQDDTDEAAIVEGVLAGLTPEAIAAAIPAGLARDVADELARRLAS